MKIAEFKMKNGWAAMALVSFLAIMTCNRQSSRPETGAIQPDSSIPDREGWNASIRITEAGQLSAIIKYGHMIYFDKNETNFFNDGVQVDIFDEYGRHTTKLTADSGRFDEKSNDIHAIGNVIVVSDTGATLKTPVLKWDQALEKIISDTNVMVTTLDNDTIYGTAMQSKPDLSRMEIRNPSGTRQEGINFDSLEDGFENDEKNQE